MTDRKISLSHSTDGGHNYSEPRVIEMGPTGAFRQVLEERCFGRGEQWVFAVEVSSNVRFDILDGAWESEVTR